MKSSKKFILISVLLTAILVAVSLFSFPGQIKSPIGQSNKPVDKVLQKEYVKILFVGDLMFDRGIRYYANKNGGNNFVFEKIYETLLDNDLVLANLEGPITNNESVSIITQPGETNNYFFTFDPSVAKTLFQNNIKLVNLGNNHILNFGRNGLESTKSYLDKVGVGYFGSPDYPKSISTRIRGTDVTYISYNEFVYLDQETNQKSTIEEIQKSKSFSDIVIIFCHWGVEYASEPTEAQKELAHKFIDAGADLIIGSHPHVIQPAETYKEKRIYYSLGNFVFDQYFSEETKKGLGVIVKIDNQSKNIDFEEISFYLQPNGQTTIKQ
jgi:poly-gamma-glutamate synthesis protein (capsule biosynthesis protein)